MRKARKSIDNYETKYRFPGNMPIIFGKLFYIYIAFTILQMILSKNDYNLAHLGKSNIVLFPFAVAIVVVAILVIRRNETGILSNLSNRKVYLVIILCYGIIYVIQLLISPHIAVKSGWDVRVIFGNAEALAYGVRDGVDIYYFSTYPNNMLLVYTVALFLKVGLMIHGEGAYAVLLAILAAISCLSGLLTSLCVYKLTENRPATFISIVIAGVMVCLSPWMTIPYSDTIGLLFPISGLFCLLYIKPYWVKYFSFTFACFLGYLYKPTVAILFIAFMLVKICTVVVKTRNREANFRQWGTAIASVLVALLCVLAINESVQALNSSPMEKEKQMGMSHYLMMGLNNESGGMYSASDVSFSESFETREERRVANLQAATQRLKEMGFKGIIELLLRKNISNYNDGTFGWGREGSFYYEILPDNSKTAEVLRSIFFTNEMGTYNWIYASILQILWLSVLLGVSLCFVTTGKGDIYTILPLTLLGLSAFLLIFECRARYVFLYLPVYILLACQGLTNISEKLVKIKFKKREAEKKP